MTKKSLLMSIKPEYADLIFSGKKTVELRRTRPNLRKGDMVIVYVSSPIKAIKGVFEVDKIHWGKPSTIWSRCWKQSKISRIEFDKYFDGVDIAYGIELGRSWMYETELNLAGLRKNLNLEPPQSFRYLNISQVEKVFAMTNFS